MEGESGLLTGQRELAEEADLMAARWDLLLDLHTSPGCSDEHLRVFLARGPLAGAGGTSGTSASTRRPR